MPPPGVAEILILSKMYRACCQGSARDGFLEAAVIASIS